MSVYEPIMNALLSRLESFCGDTFAYYSRKFVTWQDLADKSQSGVLSIKFPALFLYDGVGFGGGRIDYEHPGRRGTPVTRTMHRTIVVYAYLSGSDTPQGPDVSAIGGTTFAPLVESIESAFAPETGDGPGGTVTLGGLVSHCRIQGASDWVTGDIDPTGLGMFWMPVHILIP